MKISKKVVLIGHFGVGKSSLIRRFVENTFSDDYKVTIGVHIFKKNVAIPEEDKDVSLVIWDLEGNDDIKDTRSSYLLGTNAYIYVFDVSRPATYNTISTDIEYLKKHSDKTLIKVVGNKQDLLTKEQVMDLSREIEPLVDFFTSAKTGNKVDELFSKLAAQLIQ